VPVSETPRKHRGATKPKLPLSGPIKEWDDWGFIRDADGHLIAVAKFEYLGLTEKELDEFRSREEDPSNPAMRMIIDRINMHDELVAALTDVMEQLEHSGYAHDHPGLTRARAAVAKAKGTEP